MRYLTIALTKGRLAKKTLEIFEKIGITCEEMKDPDSRKLIFTNEELKLKFFLAKGPDVPTYVEYGAADIGIVGKDTILEEGRRIYDNIRKAIQFLLGSNMSEVLSIFISTLMGFTILKPVHLLWINLVTDCFPALALGMEKAEPDIMRRKPRSAKAGVFAGGMGFDVAYQGVLVTVLVLASYFIGHFMEAGVWEITNSADGMTMAFLTMSMAEIFHSFNMRSQRGSIFALKTFNKALMIAAVGSLVATTVVCEVPFIANAFGFETVEFSEYAVAIGLGALIIPLVEAVKLLQRKIAK